MKSGEETQLYQLWTYLGSRMM